jgi:sulfide:quinone oxidoreductase
MSAAPHRFGHRAASRVARVVDLFRDRGNVEDELSGEVEDSSGGNQLPRLLRDRKKGVSTSGRSRDRLRVVVGGGGVAGLEGVLTLAERAGELLDVTLVAERHDFVPRAQAVGELFALGRSDRLWLRDIARHTGARFHRARVTGVDAESRRLLLADDSLPYDALLLTLGACSLPAYPTATTWREADPDALAGLVRDVEEGYSRSVAFVVPPGPVWPMPAYELALMLHRDAYGMGEDVEITLVTSEPRPLAAFGSTVSAAAAGELERAGIRVEAGVTAELERGHRTTLRLRPSDRTVEVDRVVALPRMQGRRLDGVPTDDDGFIPVGDHGAVAGLEHVWAAGDGIAHPVKHGGLAAQQAAAAAVAIAAITGVDVNGAGSPSSPPDGAVGERLATYLGNHGAGTSLRSRLVWLAGDAGELRNGGPS